MDNRRLISELLRASNLRRMSIYTVATRLGVSPDYWGRVCTYQQEPKLDELREWAAILGYNLAITLIYNLVERHVKRQGF